MNGRSNSSPQATRFLVIWGTAVLTVGLLVRLTSSTSFAQQNAAQVVSASKPAVVYIVCSTNSGAQSGSGFVLVSTATSSLIITANHVVEGVNEVDVIFDSDVRKRYPATVVHHDHVKDVAVLSVKVGNRPTLSLERPSAFSEGSPILVVGYPRATLQFRRIEGDDLRPSVHSGIVSAIRLGGEIIQFDATIDHGDSGGPIIDSVTGKVVAIVRGSPLDPSYAARGMEQALPGSGFGPSADAISSVAQISSVADISSATTRITRPVGPASLSTNERDISSESSQAANSASYRLGYGIPQTTVTYGGQDLGNQINGSVDASVLDRLVKFLKGDNSLYLVPLSLSSDALSDTQHLAAYCEDNRLNLIAAPSYRWNLTGGPRYNSFGGIDGYNGTASVTMSLAVFDCFGQPFFSAVKTKSENRFFAHRSPDREIVDMANDMLDQITKELAQVQMSSSAAWNSLLKVGIAYDPADPTFHSMFYFRKLPEGYRVVIVVPGGPIDKAGVRVQDIIQAINGLDTSNMTVSEIQQKLNSPQYNLTVQRPGGSTTVVVNPIRYAEVIKLVRH